MSKDENRGRRDERKQNRKNAGEVYESAPLVSAKRGKFETLERAQIEALVFKRLEDYRNFVAEVEGEKPDDGAIISAGLELLFDADLGFEKWTAEQRRRSRNGAHSSTNGSGAKGSATATASSGAV